MSNLTVEKVLEAKRLIEKYSHDPIKELFEEYGYSIDKGDILVIPRQIALEYPELEKHPNIVESPHVFRMVFVRKPTMLLPTLLEKIE